MKNSLLKSLSYGFAVMMAGLVMGCGPEVIPDVQEPVDKPDEQPSDTTEVTDPNIGDFALELKSVEADGVELLVKAPYEVEIAYQVLRQPKTFSPAVLFKDVPNSTIATVAPGDVLKVNENVEQDAVHYLYAAAKLDEKNYSKLVQIEFTTPAYNFTELVTVVDTYYDGYKVHITVPQETKDRGNVIRYGSTSLAWYNLLKNSKGGDSVDLNAIVANGNPYGNYVKNDSTVIFNDANVVLLDKNGDPVMDSDNQMIDIHDPIAPNEPSIFLAGECRLGDQWEFADIMGYQLISSLEPVYTYTIPLFDWDKGWTGAFQKKEFFTKTPSVCEATVTVDIPEEEIGVTDAMIYFTMDEGVSRYFYMVLDNSTYNQILSTYLDGHEEWYQWFLTSYIAFYEWGVVGEVEDKAVNAAAGFVEPLTGGDTYHVLVTVMGADNGSQQNFIHKTFTAKEKTKRAPVIEIAAVQNGDPYLATFNIKAPNKDVVGSYWACDYAREFELMFNAKYTYADILKGNYSFTSAEIAEINSDKGLEISFPTLDGEVTRLAAYGCNDEYTFNYIDPDKEGAGWADYKAPMAEKKAAINSPLFDALEGEWTATAMIVAKEQVEDGSYVSYNVQHSSKVVISGEAPEVPAVLEPSVYPLYSGKSKDEVDGMFEELGILTDQFSEYRLEGQNRLLCNGFIDFDYYTDPGRLTYRSPYDLFKAVDYASVDVPMLLYDFGPKWFLEVREDGSVIVPFNSTYLPPMHKWPGYPFYLGGVAGGSAFIDATDKVPGFPVEIASDYNTIIVKPIVIAQSDATAELPAGSYYMNSIGLGQNGLEIVATVISEIVLTRGWTEPEKPEEIPAAAPERLNAVTVDGKAVTELPKPRVIKSMTGLKVDPRREYKMDETPNVVTMEMVEETSEKILKHFNVQ